MALKAKDAIVLVSVPLILNYWLICVKWEGLNNSSILFYPELAPFLPYPAYPSLLIKCDFLCPSFSPLLSFCPALSLSPVRADHVTLMVNFALFVGETQVSISPFRLRCLFVLLFSPCFRQCCCGNCLVQYMHCSYGGFVLKQQQPKTFVVLLQVVIRSRLDQSMEECQDLKVSIHIVIVRFCAI